LEIVCAEIIDENHSSFQYYKVVHQNAFLSEFPYNTCNFSRIVDIDFAGNISIPVFYGQRSNMSVPWVYPPVWLCPAKTAVKKRRYQVVG
jgi:hypothetical protein